MINYMFKLSDVYKMGFMPVCKLIPWQMTYINDCPLLLTSQQDKDSNREPSIVHTFPLTLEEMNSPWIHSLYVLDLCRYISNYQSLGR